jgi:prepilin-type processing-associated H-X9-DG protein
VGLALHHFHDTHGAFPPAGVTGPFPPLGITTPGAKHGWASFLLCYLEQDNLANLYHFEVDARDPLNFDAQRVPLKIMQCPSADTSRRLLSPVDAGLLPCVDYAALRGINSVLADQGWIDPVGNYQGAMPKDTMVPIAQITDGTSQTMIIAEDADRPKLWHAGHEVPDQLLQCGPWHEWGDCDLVPQGSTPDGAAGPGPCGINCTNQSQVYSLHPGGANTTFADGSVHFLKASIDIRVFAALVTRAGGEVVSAGDY